MCGHAALICVAFSVALVLTPAAYHRQAEAGRVSRYLASLFTIFLTLAMVPMMVGIVLDVYVSLNLVTSSARAAAVRSLSLFGAFVLLWSVFPRIARRKLPPKPKKGARALQ